MWRESPDWPSAPAKDQATDGAVYSVGLGSLLAIDNEFLILGEYGHLVRAELSPRGYRELQRCRLFSAGETWCAPVLSHGLLYVSQNRPDAITGKPPRLLCYDLRQAR